jgi:hypothetical protein
VAVLAWVQATAVSAGTAYAIPAAAGLPPQAYLVGVRSVVIAPLANAGAASTVSPIEETGVANNTSAPAAGQVSLQTATQELVSGDAIPANSVIIANLVLPNERPVSP